jgi:hypothetical protein
MLMCIEAEMLRVYPSQRCPPSFSICNISSPRPTWEPSHPQAPPPPQPRVTYKYLSTTDPLRDSKWNLQVACRTFHNRGIQYHPYRTHGRMYPSISEVDEDMFLMAESLGRQPQADETHSCRLYRQDRIEGELIYRLPSADESSEIMGTAVPVPALMSGWSDDEDGEEMEIITEEQKLMSWSSGNEIDISSKLATPGVDTEDSFGIGRVVMVSPESSPSILTFMPRCTLDYSKPPLPSVPATSHRASSPPRTPSPPKFKSSRRSASPSPRTPPPRTTRPKASRLPPLLSFPARYPRESRKPPPINCGVSTDLGTVHELGSCLHPFALTTFPKICAPKYLLPALEIKSPRTYHRNRVAEEDIPSRALISSPRLTAINSDLSSALDRLITVCGEESIDMGGSVSDSTSESVIFSCPHSAATASAIPPISARLFVLAGPPMRARPLSPPSHSPGQGRRRKGREITISGHDFLKGLSGPASSDLRSEGSSGSGRALPKRK